LRADIRRARREQEAYMQSNPSDNPDELWQQMAPALNDVIDSLREKDRNAIVLRFLKGKDLQGSRRRPGWKRGSRADARQPGIGEIAETVREKGRGPFGSNAGRRHDRTGNPSRTRWVRGLGCYHRRSRHCPGCINPDTRGRSNEVYGVDKSEVRRRRGRGHTDRV